MRGSEGGGKVLLHFRSGQADARATRFQKGQGGKCADSIKINPNYEQFIHLAEQPSARVRALKIFPQLCPFPRPAPHLQHLLCLAPFQLLLQRRQAALRWPKDASGLCQIKNAFIALALLRSMALFIQILAYIYIY